ncbi:uncharacterized protein [Haliotis asinina]|uniref:uncharacterized protein n=1 Tax=Haliotis asinina TaxID=109174 RepID=UPI003531D734
MNESDAAMAAMMEDVASIPSEPEADKDNGSGHIARNCKAEENQERSCHICFRSIEICNCFSDIEDEERFSDSDSDLERELAPTKSWDEVPLEHISKENHADGTEETKRNQKEETKLQGTEKTAKEDKTQVIPFAEDISDCEKEDKDTTDKNALLQESLDTREEDKDIQKPTGVSSAKWTIASRKRARRHKLQPKLSETVLQNNDLKNKVRESKKDQQKKKKAEKVNDRRELSGVLENVMETP